MQTSIRAGLELQVGATPLRPDVARAARSLHALTRNLHSCLARAGPLARLPLLAYAVQCKEREVARHGLCRGSSLEWSNEGAG